MPQFDFVQEQLLLGAVATTTAGGGDIDSYTNEVLAQVNTIPIGGTTDGVYTVQLDGDEGTFQFSFTASTNTADQIADGLAAAVLADPDLLNIVDASATSGTPVLLTFRHTNQVWTITFPSNPGSNMTLTTTTAAGGTDIGLGLAVVSGTAQNFCIAPTAGSVAADFLGVTERSLASQINRGIPTDVDSFEPGNSVSVLSRGDITVFAEDAVTFGAQVFVRIVATGTESFGAIRSDVDGTDAIAWPGAIFQDTSTAAGLVRIRVNLP